MTIQATRHNPVRMQRDQLVTAADPSSGIGDPLLLDLGVRPIPRSIDSGIWNAG